MMQSARGLSDSADRDTIEFMTLVLMMLSVVLVVVSAIRFNFYGFYRDCYCCRHIFVPVMQVLLSFLALLS